jgi:2-polyprenyl-3-methyl-5-hydroxy-6-metoxy-1,4-benzoquinol methylase
VAKLQFEKDYFTNRRYTFKEELVERHVLEVIRWASRISRSSLSSGKGKKALDVGCAYGYGSKVLETLGYETYAVDISRWGIRQAKKNGDEHFLVCDAQTKLPFKAKTFDLVTCFDVLEHLRLPEMAIQNMLEICGDAMICTTTNKAVEKPVKKIMRDIDETHINVRFPSEWEKCIRDRMDYKLLKIETFYDLTARLGKRLLYFRSFKVPYFGLTVRILVRK